MAGDRSPVVLDHVVGPRTRRQAVAFVVLSLTLFVVSFVGYAGDVFAVAGGVVFFPGDAALLGGIAALGVGYVHRGWLLAAGGMHAAALGYLAANALFNYAGRSFAERLQLLVDLEGVIFLGVIAAFLSLWPYLLGASVQYLVTVLRADDGRRVGQP